MALITCQDCGAEISEAATSCPKCGRLAPSAIKDKRWKEAGELALAIVIIAYLLWKYLPRFLS